MSPCLLSASCHNPSFAGGTVPISGGLPGTNRAKDAQESMHLKSSDSMDPDPLAPVLPVRCVAIKMPSVDRLQPSKATGQCLVLVSRKMFGPAHRSGKASGLQMQLTMLSIA